MTRKSRNEKAIEVANADPHRIANAVVEADWLEDALAEFDTSGALLNLSEGESDIHIRDEMNRVSEGLRKAQEEDPQLWAAHRLRKCVEKHIITLELFQRDFLSLQAEALEPGFTDNARAICECLQVLSDEERKTKTFTPSLLTRVVEQTLARPISEARVLAMQTDSLNLSKGPGAIPISLAPLVGAVEVDGDFKVSPIPGELPYHRYRIPQESEDLFSGGPRTLNSKPVRDVVIEALATEHLTGDERNRLRGDIMKIAHGAFRAREAPYRSRRRSAHTSSVATRPRPASGAGTWH